MPNSGVLAEFTFNGTTYDADDCLQNWNLTRAKEDITYYCNGNVRHLAGNATHIFTASLALSNTDTTKVSALDVGSTGTWSGFPAGDTATYIQFASTNGTVINSDIGAPQNGVITMDVTIALDDVTDSAAS